MVETIIKVDSVSKSFKLPHEKRNSVKSQFINMFRGHRTYEKQQVLNNVSFEIKRGDFFGIVGRNGSGKSTLLKLVAGIYTPDKGAITINGLLTPFIELGVGFNPELTGRENVFLNGALLGFNRAEMEAMYDEIVDFAELHKFMDQKLKNYSSGMQVRLAFSIAIRAKSDTLLIDEVLAVGDLDFQKKCYNYFYDLKNHKQTVVLVTHDMGAVRKFCNKTVLISGGEIKKIGAPDEVAKMYEEINLRAAEGRLQKTNDTPKFKAREGTKAAEIISTQTFNADSKKIQNTFNADEKIGVRLIYKINETVKEPSLSFIFQDSENGTVFATNNWLKNQPTKTVHPGDQVILEVVVNNVFTNGEYTVTSAIESTDFLTIYDRIERTHRFAIGGHPLEHAHVHPPHTMTVTYSNPKKHHD